MKSVARSFHVLEPKGSKWHLFSWGAMAGNYLLMMFYTTLSGWTLAYTLKFAKGDFVGLNPDEMGASFGAFVGNPGQQVLWLVITCVLGFTVCSGGLVKGVERITKPMMVALFIIVFGLAIRALMLPAAGEGLAFLLKPNLNAVRENGFFVVVHRALGQAMFTLSVGIGSMAIFGSYIKKEKRLFGESLIIGGLDLFVSLMAGIIVFACCFTFNVAPGAGPTLVFISLPNIFNVMAGGRIFGTLFFLFFAFAAISTVIAVFENIIAFSIDMFNSSRLKACIINFLVLTTLSIPCALGFNLLSVGGENFVLDIEDLLVSDILLPLGALIFLLFCVSKKGWGWDNFIAEVNTGSGIRFPVVLKYFFVWVAPLIIIAIFVIGIIQKFIG
jgi:NSS family neurotransmitter:Na+ symporter